ncbi:hypothetical protein [Lactococcus termiticola]|uniref:Uncharacterized protein n=1 Tax=Lactococcus termiticola TaxID=2169526 RepID=A0A2R5HI82_9LACT|nr:hypothetical protein [Lactococcus termiticola]GBG97215.1 hypothetical protein NtB2_01353 [Lactococcus termiticola]
MSKQEDWLQDFEAKNGRKPSLEEFSEAQKNAFAIEEADPKALWLAEFKKAEGRDPSLAEFEAAKNNGFQMSEAKASEETKEVETAEAEAPAAAEAAPLSTEEQWIQDFEAREGRKPAMNEFLAAKANSFSSEASPVEAQETTQATNAQTQVAPAAAAYAQPQPQVKPKAPRQKMKTKTKLILTASAVVVVAAGLWATGEFWYFSKAEQLNRYVAAYNKNPEAASIDGKTYIWSDTKKAIKKTDLKYSPNMADKISKDHLLAGTQFKQDGYQYLVFPKYKVFVDPESLTLKANSKGLNLSVNGNKIASSTSANFKTTVARLFPGDYKIDAVGKINNKSVNLTKTVTVDHANTVGNFQLSFLTFNLYSNLVNADVYSGKDKIGSLTNGQYKFVDLPVVSNDQISVQKAFKSGVAKTPVKWVSDITDGDSVYLNWDQELSNDTAKELFSSAFSDISSDNGASSVFEGGSDNSFYKALTGRFTHMKSPSDATHHQASSISVESSNVDSITQNDINDYTVNVSIVLDVYYNSEKQNPYYGDFYQKRTFSIHVKYVPQSDNDSDSDSYYNSSNDSSDTSGGNYKNFVIVNDAGNAQDGDSTKTTVKDDTKHDSSYDDDDSDN